MSTPAGWYPIPDDPSRLRYWDGAEWTGHFHRDVEDSPPPPPPEGDAPSVPADEMMPPSPPVPTEDAPMPVDEGAGAEPTELSTRSPWGPAGGLDEETAAHDLFWGPSDGVEQQGESEDSDGTVDPGDENSDPERSEAVAGRLESDADYDPLAPEPLEDRPKRSRAALQWVLVVFVLFGAGVAGVLVAAELGRGGEVSLVDPGQSETTTTTAAVFVRPSSTRFPISEATTTTTATTTPSDGAVTTTVAPGGLNPTTAAPPTSVATTTPAVTTSTATAQRSVTLLVDVAKLRSGPILSATEVDTITGLSGSTITALGAPKNGWYEVTVGSQQGWVFGAFIVPPAEGLTVLQTRSGGTVALLDDKGVSLGKENASGSYALATDTTGEFWPVILAEGGTAFVKAADMKLRS